MRFVNVARSPMEVNFDIGVSATGLIALRALFYYYTRNLARLPLSQFHSDVRRERVLKKRDCIRKYNDDVIGIIKNYIKNLDCIPTSDEHFKYSNKMISRENAMIVDYRSRIFHKIFHLCNTCFINVFQSYFYFIHRYINYPKYMNFYIAWFNPVITQIENIKYKYKFYIVNYIVNLKR